MLTTPGSQRVNNFLVCAGRCRGGFSPLGSARKVQNMNFILWPCELKIPPKFADFSVIFAVEGWLATVLPGG